MKKIAALKYSPYFFYQYSKGILATFAGRLITNMFIRTIFINVFFLKNEQFFSFIYNLQVPQIP